MGFVEGAGSGDSELGGGGCIGRADCRVARVRSGGPWMVPFVLAGGLLSIVRVVTRGGWRGGGC